MSVKEQYINMVINMIKNAEEIYDIKIEPEVKIDDFGYFERIIDTKLRTITIRLKRGDDKDERAKEDNETTDQYITKFPGIST